MATGTRSSTAALDKDMEPKTSESSESIKAQANDLQRCLKLRGLPLSVLYDRENFETKVRELLLGTFSLKPDHIVAVERLSVQESGKEVDVEALVRCASRIQKNLIFLGREKLSSPIKLVEVSGDEHPLRPKEAEKEAMDDSLERKSEDGFVVESIGNDEGDRDEEVDYNEEMGEGEEEEENEDEEGDPTGIRDSKGRSEREGSKSPEPKEEEVDEERNEHLNDCLNENRKDDQEPASSEKGSEKGEGEKEVKREPERLPRPRPQKVWEGAPEFQWKSVKGSDEWCRLVVDNVSMADLRNPFIYQSLIRARSVNLNFINASVKGSYDHQLFRKGRLTMTFISDTQAMAQAVNGLVFVRTPAHRPRLKVLLPQTTLTMQMKHLLEMKLGRVLEPHDKSRRLLVRPPPPDHAHHADEAPPREEARPRPRAPRQEPPTPRETSSPRPRSPCR